MKKEGFKSDGTEFKTYRSLNFSHWFLEPMIINSVLLGFSFSYEFVIQVKTSVTQDFKSVRDSKASKPDRDI